MMNEVERISAKPYPWGKIVDFNPDHQRSSSAIRIEALGERVLGVLQVKGLGVLVFAATPSKNKGKTTEFDGMLSTFSIDEIGYSERL